MITVIDENNLPVKYVKCESGTEDMQCGIGQTWIKGIVCAQNDIKNESYEKRLEDQIKKNKRQEVVCSIEVVYNGIIYQGDELSQDRMSRNIVGMDDDDTIEWKAKDNSKVTLLKSDLKQILRLACIEQTKLW